MERFDRFYAPRLRGLRASSIREICKLITRPDITSLAGGWPDPATFPVAEVVALVRDMLTEHGEFALQYGSSEGLPELREALAVRAARLEGVEVAAEDIVITAGASQAIQLVSKALIEPGDVVLVGSPTYFGATGTFRSFEAELVGIPLDAAGEDVDALAATLPALRAAGKRVKFLYVIPDFQNPAGSTLALERRHRLLGLADEFDFLVLEDNPYGDLRFEGAPLPSLKALDKSGRVIYMRSFSKTFAPGLRMAWFAGEHDLIRRIVILRQYDDACANTLAQYVLLGFIRSGGLDRRIRENVAFYRRKRDRMLELLAAHFPPGVQWNRPEGGFFVFVQLPPRLDADDVAARALERGVAFVSGRPFHVDGRGSNTLRLSYSQADLAGMERAVRRLGDVLRECLE